MNLVKIGADTTVRTQACFLKMLVLDHSAATVVAVYNEVDATHTAGSKRFSMQTTANELCKWVIFPGRGLRLETGLHIDWTAGDVYYGIG